MGLSAVVFKNALSVIEAYGKDFIDVDPETGEAYPKAGVKIKIPDDIRFASKQRIGNIAQVGFLREEVLKIVGDSNSILIQKVLYSGTHCGDFLMPSDIVVLQQEVDLLKKSNNDQLEEFIQSMDSLILASIAEQNPIVFI